MAEPEIQLPKTSIFVSPTYYSVSACSETVQTARYAAFLELSVTGPSSAVGGCGIDGRGVQIREDVSNTANKASDGLVIS